MRLLPTLLAAFYFFVLSAAQGASYYISSTGNDANSGLTPALAWRTIAQINARNFKPGDKILFEGGSTFSGGIWLSHHSAGTPEAPIVISSYGSGAATIHSGNGFGFYAHNTAGIELRRLNFMGSGRLSNTATGVSFYIDSADTHLQHLVLDSLEVSGYREAGISVGSWKGASSYTGVCITNCSTHDNGKAGLESYSEALAAHSNWYIGSCKAYNNSGRTDITNVHTGNGIVIGGVDGVLIEYCLAYNNGWLNANPHGGPVGIWGWNCNNLIIQYSESHHNKSGTNHDGGGFDIDGGCTNSILQYNYSHDNDGPGYLIAQYVGAPPLHDVVIRYNISENDDRRYSQGAILLWSSGDNGGIQRASIYNNTVYLTPSANGTTPKAIYLSSGGIATTTFHNNLIQTTGGVPLIVAEWGGTSGVQFQGNCYWSTGQPFAIQWGGNRFSGLSDWREATGQEKLGNRLLGLNVDPRLMLPKSFAGWGTTPSRPLQVHSAYQLEGSSPLIGAGLNLAAEFGTNVGKFDFFGLSAPTKNQPANIGAYEGRTIVQASRSSAAQPSWCTPYPNPAHGTLHLNLTAAPSSTLTVQLFDMQGRLCRTHSVRGAAPAAAVTIPTSELAAGLYLLRVACGALVHQERILLDAN